MSSKNDIPMATLKRAALKRRSKENWKRYQKERKCLPRPVRCCGAVKLSADKEKQK